MTWEPKMRPQGADWTFLLGVTRRNTTGGGTRQGRNVSNRGGGGDLSRACDLGFFPGTFGSKMLLSSGSGVWGPGWGDTSRMSISEKAGEGQND